jgi:hypothetical protein
MVYVSFWIPRDFYDEVKKAADELRVSVGELAREALREKWEEVVKMRGEARTRGVRLGWGAAFIVSALINSEDLLVALLRFLKRVDPELLEEVLKRAGVVGEEWKIGGEEEGRGEEKRADEGSERR